MGKRKENKKEKKKIKEKREEIKFLLLNNDVY